MKYLHRIKYGRYVAISTGHTMDGSLYSMKAKGGGYFVGGPHNYEVINLIMYVLLGVKYFLIRNLFPHIYKTIIDKSWKS